MPFLLCLSCSVFDMGKLKTKSKMYMELWPLLLLPCKLYYMLLLLLMPVVFLFDKEVGFFVVLLVAKNWWGLRDFEPIHEFEANKYRTLVPQIVMPRVISV